MYWRFWRLRCFHTFEWNVRFVRVHGALVVNAKCDKRSSLQSDLIVTVQYNTSLVSGEHTGRFVQSSLTVDQCQKQLDAIPSVGQRTQIVISREDVLDVAYLQDLPVDMGRHRRLDEGPYSRSRTRSH